MRLQLTGISKYFPGVKALDGIQFDLLPGEVHAVCGENGAGKSTLMNILTGNLVPDAGEVLLNGKSTRIKDPSDAAKKGIAIVYQQLSLIDTLSVSENIFANTQPRNKWGLIQYTALNEKRSNCLKTCRSPISSPENRLENYHRVKSKWLKLPKHFLKIRIF